jgi:hypothetical protein
MEQDELISTLHNGKVASFEIVDFEIMNLDSQVHLKFLFKIKKLCQYSWNVRGKFKSSIQIKLCRKKVARNSWNDTIASCNGKCRGVFQG